MSQNAKHPGFLIIGAAKAGTTAMFRALSRHPQIFCSPIKEPRFFAFAGAAPHFNCPCGKEFSDSIVTKEKEYFDLFSACPNGPIAGEASPVYLSSAGAPVTASRYAPHARLVAILRHPVDRAYSQWLHNRQEGKESLEDFETAWNAEDQRRDQGWSFIWEYRNRGFYGRQLEHWLEYFPREQLLVLFYEDWLHQPGQTLDSVFKHLGIGPSPVVITHENVTSRQPRWLWLHQRMVENNALRRWAQRKIPLSVRDAITHSIASMNLKAGPKIDPALRARLATVYHEDLRRVEALTQRDLSGWRS